MKSYFSFNPEVYNYWPIYEIITKFYPVGLEAEPFNCAAKYPGYGKLEKIITENIHNEENFQQRWQSFESGLQQELNKEVIGTTYGQSPSFSSEIILDKIETEKIAYYKKLCFAVSLTGPFYTIYGTDETAIRDNKSNRYTSWQINALTVSPYMEFEPIFLLVEDIIKKKFKDCRLVPFCVSLKYISGLQMETRGFDEYSVFQSLFHDQLYTLTGYHVHGDESYGSEHWKIPGTITGGWTAYPPSAGDPQ